MTNRPVIQSPPLEPTCYPSATLVDLLDRVLDKGLIIDADIIISVAGVPLIGLNLRAALAGMDTMVRHGFMRESDQRSRVWEQERRTSKGLPLLEASRLVE